MNILFIGLLLCAAALVLWGINTYNSLIKSKGTVSEAWSTIDILLKKRALRISELLHVIKQESEEYAPIPELIHLQHTATIANTIPAISEAELKISTVLKQLSEELTLSAQLQHLPAVKDLTKQLNELDGELQAARMAYNGATRNYNIIVHTIPSALIAKMMSFESQPYFEVI